MKQAHLLTDLRHFKTLIDFLCESGLNLSEYKRINVSVTTSRMLIDIIPKIMIVEFTLGLKRINCYCYDVFEYVLFLLARSLNLV